MEKRSDGAGIADRGFATLPYGQHHTPIDGHPRGVGGGHIHPAPGGGGYQDVCTTDKPRDEAKKKFARDPRLDHLRKMGFHPTWQRVAAAIGMDAFLEMWRILDAEDQFHHPKGNLEISLRRYRSYVRFQRDQYIRQLAAGGMGPKQIATRLQVALCEKLAPTRISTIINDK